MFLFYIGVDLPVKLADHEIVASTDNKSLYTIGSVHSNKDIYKFTCNKSMADCSWTKIPTKLQYGRRWTVAMTMPKVLVNKLCN